VNQQGFWEAAMDDVSVNGGHLGLQGRTAILDTGQYLDISLISYHYSLHDYQVLL
jgi:hypothetical protein